MNERGRVHFMMRRASCIPVDAGFDATFCALLRAAVRLAGHAGELADERRFTPLARSWPSPHSFSRPFTTDRANSCVYS